MDDTTAFALAVASARAGIVCVPEGSFDLRGLEVGVADVSIVCAGQDVTTLRAAPGDDGAPLLHVVANDFAIRDCTLDGNAALTTSYYSDSFEGRVWSSALAMHAAGTRLSGLTVDRCTFANVRGAPIATRDVDGLTVRDSTFSDNLFESVFHASSIATGSTERLDGFTFTGNTTTNCRSNHASVNANGLVLHQTANVTIEDNVFDGFERNAMKLENCAAVSVMRNEIANGDLSWAGIGMQNGIDDAVVASNELTNVGSGIDTSGNAGDGGASAAIVRNVTIRENVIDGVHEGALPDGIRLLGYGPGIEEITIEDNTISNVPRDMIQLRQFTQWNPEATLQDITIRNNTGTGIGGACVSFAGSDVAPVDVIDERNVCR